VDGAFELESGGELAIVGGTGEFARAQGTIASTYTRVDEKVLRELDMHFGCPVFTEPVKMSLMFVLFGTLSTYDRNT
jgi:hypothetical protein